jgi:hypothetical protein
VLSNTLSNGPIGKVSLVLRLGISGVTVGISGVTVGITPVTRSGMVFDRTKAPPLVPVAFLSLHNACLTAAGEMPNTLAIVEFLALKTGNPWMYAQIILSCSENPR